jgi:hypothetical protein
MSGFAFGGEGGNDKDRLEILLALPVILSGLGLAYLSLSHGSTEIGTYIRDCLWPALQSAAPDPADKGGGVSLPSWEKVVSDGRGLSSGGALSTRGTLSWLPGFFIFGVPSLAALVLNWEHAPGWLKVGADGGDLQTAWVIDAIAVLLSAVLMLLAGKRQPTDRRVW